MTIDRDTLRRLLPELLVSLVTMTCMTTFMTYRDGMDTSAHLMTNAFAQLVVQTVLYVITYLVDDKRLSEGGWVILAMGSVFICMSMSPFDLLVGSGSQDLSFTLMVSSLMGMMLFYLTRLRPLFALLLVEVIGMVELVDEMPALLPVHVVGTVSLAALFVMRCSATHIAKPTLASKLAADDDEADDAPRPFLGVVGQNLVLTATVVALALATACAGYALMRRAAAARAPEPDVSVQAVQGDEPAETGPQSQLLEEAPAEAPAAEDATDDGQAGEPAPPADGRTAPHVPPAVLLLAALALPLPLRLLMRGWARHRLAREPRTADRAARLYLAVIARLKAAGIERTDEQTPQEFLAQHAIELGELTMPAGIAPTAWVTLTAAYQTARYAGLDPTEDELACCWELYDALPTCTRQALGWRRYLTGAFWRM